jgi:hypothetical protein
MHHKPPPTATNRPTLDARTRDIPETSSGIRHAGAVLTGQPTAPNTCRQAILAMKVLALTDRPQDGREQTSIIGFVAQKTSQAHSAASALSDHEGRHQPWRCCNSIAAAATSAAMLLQHLQGSRTVGIVYHGRAEHHRAARVGLDHLARARNSRKLASRHWRWGFDEVSLRGVNYHVACRVQWKWWVGWWSCCRVAPARWK